MKVQNGPDAAFEMRNRLNFKGKIVGITGNVLADDLERFLAMGVDQVITKPLRPEELKTALRSLFTCFS